MSILYRSAFALGKDIIAGRLSSVEVLTFFLDRVEKFNPSLNAVVALDTERAMVRAEAADAAIDSGEIWGPLHGVPLTIKDALLTEGLVTVGGIPDFRDFIPDRNAEPLQRYIDAGAIVFGKTNVPFMSSDLQSYNEVYGQTNNPWNILRTCGGSSGGAAAAVAAGLTPLELGSDIGGSIRTPAHFNGVFGHKPSHNIVPMRGHLPPGPGLLGEADLAVVGPIATNAGDLQDALDLLVGPNADEAVARKIELPAARCLDPKQLRVATLFDVAGINTDKELIEILQGAANSLEQAGANVEHNVDLGFDVLEHHQNYLLLLNSAMSARLPREHRAKLAEMVAAAGPDDNSPTITSARGATLSHADWLIQNELRLQFRDKWRQLFTQYDVLLCPCTNVPAFPHDHSDNMLTRTLEVNGQTTPYVDVLFWAGFSLNTYLPATSVPVGRTHEGLPIGIQIVGPYLEDKTTIAVAAMLEQCHQSFVAPPGFTE